MSTITFDTLKFVKELESAGVPDAQAEAQARALSNVLETNVKDLVTKSDLEHQVEMIRRDIQEMEMRLTIKLGAFIAGAAAIFAGISKMMS